MYAYAQVREAIHSSTGTAPLRPYGVELTPDKLRYLREDQTFEPWRANLRAIAERAVNEEIPLISFSAFQSFEKNGDRSAFEKPWHERRTRLQALTAVSLFDETDRYIEALENLIWEICNEFTWCMNAHMSGDWEKAMNHHVSPEKIIDLGAAMDAHLLAEAVCALGSRMSPWITHRAKSEIQRRVLRSWLEAPLPYLWEACENNWASVCSGGIGLAALLIEEDKDRLSTLIHRILECMTHFLQGFGDDGGCAEGIDYWQYGFGYYVAFADMLYIYTDGRLNLLQGDKLRAIAEFPTKISFTAEAYANYSDARQHVVLNTGLLSRLHHYLDQELPEMIRIPDTFRHHHMRSALWTDPSVLHRPGVPGSFYLPDLQWVLDRRTADRRTIGFSAKGGHNDEPHNHNDLGHFLLVAGGDILLCDLGHPQYYKDYFTSKRYEDIHAMSAGHSVPVIGGQHQCTGRGYHAEVLTYEVSEGTLRYALDLTLAYELPALSSFTREFLWTWGEREAVLELKDTFQFTETSVDLTEAFISLQLPEVTDDAVIWSGTHGSVRMEYPAGVWGASVETIEIKTGGAHNRIYRTRLDRNQTDLSVNIHLKFLVTVH